jgi:hypothetical protein
LYSRLRRQVRHPPQKQPSFATAVPFARFTCTVYSVRINALWEQTDELELIPKSAMCLLSLHTASERVACWLARMSSSPVPSERDFSEAAGLGGQTLRVTAKQAIVVQCVSSHTHTKCYKK